MQPPATSAYNATNLPAGAQPLLVTPESLVAAVELEQLADEQSHLVGAPRLGVIAR